MENNRIKLLKARNARAVHYIEVPLTLIGKV